METELYTTSSEQPVPPAALFLSQLQIPHQVFYHRGRVDSLEQAARERGQSIDQIVRSIVFRVTEESYVMGLMSGPYQIDWKLLRQLLGVNRVTMASEEEVLRVTGFRVGAVSPFGLPHPMPIYVDQHILAQTQISLGSGLRGVGIILSVQDLLSALGDQAIICSLSNQLRR